MAKYVNSSLGPFLKNLKRREFGGLVGDASFVFLCRITSAILVFLTQIILARWMGAEQLGTYVYAFAACALLSNVASLGLPTAALRVIGKGLIRGNEGYIKGFFRWSIQSVLVSSTLVVIVLLSALFLVPDLVPNGSQRSLVLAVIAVPLFSLILLFSATAQGLSWFRIAFVPNDVGRPLLHLALVGLAWYYSMQLTAENVMALHFVAISAVLAVLALLVVKNVNSKLPDIKPSYETRVWIRTGIPLLVIVIFMNYFGEVNLIIVGMKLEADQLAIFNACFRISALIAFGIFAVDSITMPRAAKLFAEGDTSNLQTVIANATRLRFWGSAAAIAILAALGKSVLGIFGEEFIQGYQTLMILSAGQLIRAAFGPVPQLLSVTGCQDQCLYVFLFSLPVMLGLHPLLIDRFGINGAAGAVVLVILLHSVWFYYIVVRQLGIQASIFGFRKSMARN